MEENGNITDYISIIKDLKYKLGDIGDKVSNSDLVTITLNVMLHEYQVFIINIVSREEAPSFDDLIRILIQEEERKNVYDTIFQNSYLALMDKGK
jgi:hypothetical protein